jgi:hypothetical protein
MLVSQRDDHALIRSKALAEGIKDVAAELRLIDVADFIAFIRTENFANIHDIVNSSLELFFKHGTLRYGSAAALDVKWGSPPAIMLDMEFRHMAISVFFNLTLRALNASVAIHYINFGEGSRTPEENTSRLIRAISDARLQAA